MFSRSKDLVIVFGLAALYVAAARLGLTLALPPERKATAVWPASGIALGAVLLFGNRVWPGIWLGAFIANCWDYFNADNAHSLAAHLAVSCGIAVGSTLQAMLGAALFRRAIGRIGPFERARSVFQFVAVTALMCLVGATIGVTTLCLSGFAPWSTYGFNWSTWWLGDAVGVCLVTPLILTWRRLPRFVHESQRLGEAALLLSLLLSVVLLVFGGWTIWGTEATSLVYLTVPLLVWATVRFGQHGATATLIVLSAIAVWYAAEGRGPFMRDTVYESLLLLQTFVGVLTVTILTLSGALTEIQRAAYARERIIERLKLSLEKVKTLRGTIPICAWCKKIRNDAGMWQQLEVYLSQHSDAEFSHGICPECTDKAMAEDWKPQRTESRVP